MKLFKITTDDFGWDDYNGFVVRAETKERAKELITKVVYNNFKGEETYEVIEIEGEEGIVLESFNSG